jgi:hypothetical protein
LPYEKIDLISEPEKNLSHTQKDTLQITAAGAFVRWFIDSEEQPGTGSTLNIAAIDYPVGIHHVTALVYVLPTLNLPFFRQANKLYQGAA